MNDYTWRVFRVNGHQLLRKDDVDKMVTDTVLTTSQAVNVCSITTVDESGHIRQAASRLPGVVSVTFGTGKHSRHWHAEWEIVYERAKNGMVGISVIGPKDLNADLVTMKFTILAVVLD